MSTATVNATTPGPAHQSDGCVKFGSFKGTTFLVHWSFFAVIVFFLIRGFISLYDPYRTMLYWIIFWGPMVFISMFLVGTYMCSTLNRRHCQGYEWKISLLYVSLFVCKFFNYSVS